jgi:2-octaprenyl-6-methoxyphenol hydroxylase
MKTEIVDVAVIGAGPVGAALACRLANEGRSVLLVDRAALPPMEHPDFDGRAYAIAYGSRPLLDMAGLWDRLAFTPCPIEQIRVSDGKPGRPASPLHLHFDHRAVGENPFGWIVEARALRVAINAQLRADPRIILRAPAEAVVTRSAEEAIITIAGDATGWWWPPMAGAVSYAPKRASPSPALPIGKVRWCAPWRMNGRIRM